PTPVGVNRRSLDCSGISRTVVPTPVGVNRQQRQHNFRQLPVVPTPVGVNLRAIATSSSAIWLSPRPWR
ncbi:MAG: hypothetical protein AAFR18_22935, partial [Cyanobacteria bacterium J06627_32]